MLSLLLAIVKINLQAAGLSAQERRPEDVQKLLEQRAMPGPQFVPGQVIVKMKQSRDLDAGAR